MADKARVTKDLTTGIGTLSFPHIFPASVVTKKDGTKSYEVQFIIPKTERDDIRAILRAIKEVGEAQWGDNWKKVRTPLRDGDKEAGDLTEDGSTKGEKYPERLGCYFINARSTKPVAVVDRLRVPITEVDAVYGGCKAKIAVSFYPYSKEGNHGIGVGLNGVQKIADGESFGSGAPAVESMFDMLDEEDVDLDAEIDEIEDEVEEEVEEAPKRAAKKTAAKKAPAKKAAAKKPAPVEIEEDEEDLYDDLDDLD